MLTAFVATGEITAISFLQIPLSIVLGITLGVIVGFALVLFFKKVHIRDSVKIMVVFSVSFLLLDVQNQLENIVPVSGLLAIMSMGITVNQKYNVLSKRLSVKYNKLWICAEVFLFVLVGMAVDLRYAFSAGVTAVILIFVALLFRISGVLLSLIKTNINKKSVFSVCSATHQKLLFRWQ